MFDQSSTSSGNYENLYISLLIWNKAIFTWKGDHGILDYWGNYFPDECLQRAHRDHIPHEKLR